MIFPVIFAALYLTHWSLLRLPYFWDEAGYYIPAAWDFFRTGSLIPVTTVTNAHPPLPSVYLALWWKVCGFHPEVTREAVLIVAAAGLLAVGAPGCRHQDQHLLTALAELVGQHLDGPGRLGVRVLETAGRQALRDWDAEDRRRYEDQDGHPDDSSRRPDSKASNPLQHVRPSTADGGRHHIRE